MITGVVFATNVTEPVEVTNPTGWGWFSAGLNVRPSASREACYATAKAVANRRQCSVQIYARSEDWSGWRQVDVVEKPDREMCEWWPAGNGPATGVEGEGCQTTATVSVGARTVYHLCDTCSDLPRFRRMRRNGWLTAHFHFSAKP